VLSALGIARLMTMAPTKLAVMPDQAASQQNRQLHAQTMHISMVQCHTYQHASQLEGKEQWHMTGSDTSVTVSTQCSPYDDDGTKTANSQQDSAGSCIQNTSHQHGTTSYGTSSCKRAGQHSAPMTMMTTSQLPAVCQAAAYKRHGSLALHSTMHTRSDHTWGAAASSTA